jgi:2-polyprenyl-6-methoxyphenol hydroxylase-like FAD-dependent oxidoreductase
MVLGLLLGRAGVDVLVLEKHADFLRDFRGDTIHPSTMELMAELGLADRVLALRHSKVSRLAMEMEGRRLVFGDLGRLRSPFPYVVFVPQWDFLDLLASEARTCPSFRLLMSAEATGVVMEHGAVCGLRYRASDGDHEIQTDLVVAADGRWSRVRESAGLVPVEASPPMDVLWFRLSRRPEEPEEVAVHMVPGRFMVMINRFSYWQVGYVILKGSDQQVRAAGLDAFRASVAALAPEVADRVGELRDWDQIKLLTVRANRLRRWCRPGLLCIGDAAHAMSPVAGVGINLAIQDAVVAANVLAGPLRRGRVRTWRLWQVQARRELPVRIAQAFQELVQRQIAAPALRSGVVSPPRALIRFDRIPALRGIPARLVGRGPWRVRLRRSLRAGARPGPATGAAG